MSRRLGLILASWLMLVAGTLQAADDLLKVIPDSALGFVAVRGLSQFDAKVQALAQQAGAPMPSPLAMAKQRLGMSEGVDDQGSVAVVIFKAPGENAMPPVAPVVLIPVTDYGKFIAQFQPEDAKATVTTIQFLHDASHVRKVGHYAAIAGGPFAELLEKDFAGGKTSVEGLAAWQKWLDEKDVELLVTRAGLEMAAKYVKLGLDMAKSFAAGAPDKQAQQQILGAIEIYAQLFAMVEKNVAVLGVGLDRDSAGTIRLTKRFQALPGSPAATMLTESSAPAENLLASLPAMPYALAGSATMTPDAAQAMMDFSAALMKGAHDLYHLSPEQVDKMLSQSRTIVKHMRGAALVMRPPAPNEPLYSNFLALMRTDDSQALLDAYPKYAEDYNAAVKGSDGPLGLMELTKLQIEGLPALQVRMDMSKAMGLSTGPGAEKAAAMMKKMFGSDGKLAMYLVAVDKRTILMSYISRDPLPAAIKLLKSGGANLAGEKGLAQTAKLLPPTACATGFVSFNGSLECAKWVISATGSPLAAVLPELPDMPPLGLAAWTSPGNLDVQLVVPAEVIKGIAETAAKLRGQ